MCISDCVSREGWGGGEVTNITVVAFLKLCRSCQSAYACIHLTMSSCFFFHTQGSVQQPDCCGGEERVSWDEEARYIVSSLLLLLLFSHWFPSSAGSPCKGNAGERSKSFLSFFLSISS